MAGAAFVLHTVREASGSPSPRGGAAAASAALGGSAEWRSPARSDPGIPSVPPPLPHATSPPTRVGTPRRAGAGGRALDRDRRREAGWQSATRGASIPSDPPPLPESAACRREAAPRHRPRGGYDSGVRLRELERGWRPLAKRDNGIGDLPVSRGAVPVGSPLGVWRYRYKSVDAPGGMYAGQFAIRADPSGGLVWCERLPTGKTLRAPLRRVGSKPPEWRSEGLPDGATLTLQHTSRGAMHASFRLRSGAHSVVVVANPAT
eukprot:TRINITY_DN23359_c0_g1_i1.p2 TRINITY_DN23359_c0_g1~~TRINITY_DN23359_c0_g1_i1.p2  ORF type:complete len:279 (+),score=66.23 TRINITY_DN23359_c0_g1_i1:53-838(+)